ncbi:MAG TPA: hypothetical protein VGG40_09170 [Solirubrobacterales bacterium]|jgi:hypothetical protein
MPALEQHTGLRFQRAEPDRLLSTVREMAPRIVLLNGEGDRSTLRADIGSIRSVSGAPLLPLVADKATGIAALR